MKPSEQAAAPSPEAGRRGRVFEVLASTGVDRDLAATAGAEALLITAPANVRYLTGFTGTSGWLLLAADAAFFLTDPRYEQQAADEVGDAEVVISSTGLPSAVARVVERQGWARIGFEPEHLTVAMKTKLEDAAGAEWLGLDGPVEELRRAKEPGELAAIRVALEIAEGALLEVATRIMPGLTEIDVAADLERACRRRGAEGMAFETIVASGPRTALPHGVATDRVIGSGEPVMIDMGCRRSGYCSDITRLTWCGGEPPGEWLELYDLVNRARAAGIDAVRADVAAKEVDAAARRVIADGGYGDAFSHGTGHGVGLEIHEAPAVSSRSVDTLSAGIVVTIEPGIYVAEKLGIRIEDMVVVTAEGSERLTALSTEPILPEFS